MFGVHCAGEALNADKGGIFTIDTHSISNQVFVFSRLSVNGKSFRSRKRNSFMKISWAVAIFVVTTKAFFKKIFSVNEKRSDLCLSSFLSLAVALRSLWSWAIHHLVRSPAEYEILRVCMERNKNYHCCCCYVLIMDKRAKDRERRHKNVTGNCSVKNIE